MLSEKITINFYSFVGSKTLKLSPLFYQLDKLDIFDVSYARTIEAKKVTYKISKISKGNL
jgi:hypothetical protein